MRKYRQISVRRNIYFALLQLKVDYKVGSWNELFERIFQDLEDLKLDKIKDFKNNKLEEKIKNGEVIKIF